jgi:hypothetical protein
LFMWTHYTHSFLLFLVSSLMASTILTFTDWVWTCWSPKCKIQSSNPLKFPRIFQPLLKSPRHPGWSHFVCCSCHWRHGQGWTCWQKLHSHAYTRATVCSFVSFTHFTYGDGLQRRYASDVAFCIIHFPLTVDNSDMS